MLPARKYNRQTWLPDFFQDFFESNALEKITTPSMNVIESDCCYKLELAAPGMGKDDFKVHINADGNLVIDMEKSKEEKDDCKKEECRKECKYLRKEFSYSKYHQVLALPENAVKDEIEACVENGVLMVKIPKMQKSKIEAEKRVIEVK